MAQDSPKAAPARPRNKTIHISPELHTELTAAADERGVSVGVLAERAIAYFLPRLIPVDQLVLVREEMPGGEQAAGS